MKYLIIDRFNDYSPNNVFIKHTGNGVAELITSYIKDAGYEVSLYNLVKKDVILNAATFNGYDNIIFLVNEDNITNVLRLRDKNIDSNKCRVYFLSVNENLSSYIPTDIQRFYMNYDERITLNDNLKVFAELLFDSELNGECNNLNLCSIAQNTKSMNVSIGNACSNSCAFCSISNTPESYYDLNTIIRQIKQKIESGIVYFHINNHSFTSDLTFVRDFCELLMKECGDLDFKWSCFVLPKNIIENLEILSVLKNANLDRIEIGFENINKPIQDEFNIKCSEQELKTILDACKQNDINSVAINYMIGAPLESEETLFESKLFLQRLIEYRSGNIDLNLYFFYPDLNTKYGSAEERIKNNCSIEKNIARKYGCVQNSRYLDRSNIYAWKLKTEDYLYKLRMKLLPNLSAKERISSCILYNYDIKTQLGICCVNTGLALLNRKEKRDNIYFFISDFIGTQAENTYSPAILNAAKVFVNKQDEKFVGIEAEFLKEGQTPYTNIDEFDFHDHFGAHRTVEEMVSLNAEKHGMDKETMRKKIINKLEEMENNHLIYYRRVLN